MCSQNPVARTSLGTSAAPSSTNMEEHQTVYMSINAVLAEGSVTDHSPKSINRAIVNYPFPTDILRPVLLAGRQVGATDICPQCLGDGVGMAVKVLRQRQAFKVVQSKYTAQLKLGLNLEAKVKESVPRSIIVYAPFLTSTKILTCLSFSLINAQYPLSTNSVISMRRVIIFPGLIFPSPKALITPWKSFLWYPNTAL